jgi:hypothetical protein
MDFSKKITTTFNSFTGDDQKLLENFYSPQVVFTDPVRSIQGLENLQKYYRHIYKNVQKIQFHFQHFIEQENQVAGEWVMDLQAKGLNFGEPFQVRGSSFFVFNEQGLVKTQNDYLDLGQMVYEKIPVLGIAVKTIRKAL